jgi:hypothetical protein
MKKISTLGINGNMIFKGHQLMFGLDLGNHWSCWPAATRIWHAAGEWLVGSLLAIIFEWPTIAVQKSGGIEKLSVSVTLCG